MQPTLVLAAESHRPAQLRVSIALAIGAAGVLATAATAAAVAHSPTLADPRAAATFRSALVALSVAVGLYTWWRRPESPLGRLVAGAGFVYAATSLNASGAPLAYTFGMLAWATQVVFTYSVFLSYPRGRLARQERRLAQGFAVATAVLWGLIIALSPTLPRAGPFADCANRCPHNALQIVPGHAAAGAALDKTYLVVASLWLAAVAMMVFRKAGSPARLRRRAIAPVSAALIANIVVAVAYMWATGAAAGEKNVLRMIAGAAALSLPVAIFIGQTRGRAFAATRAGKLAMRAGGNAATPTAVQRLIADALGDPSLTLALWAPEQHEYLDVHGAPVELPRDARSRAVSVITRNDRPVAALIHHPALDTDADVVEGLAATSLMLLENARLVQELRESRARIVRAGERERRRLERDLHDGAQAQLVAIQIRLELARELTDPAQIIEQIDAAQQDLDAALEELRDLAHGIYPAALRDLGPAGALHTLAHNSSVPVEVIDDGIGRLSDTTEAAIYFCAHEAIQNTAKHAGPHAKATVRLQRSPSGIELVISDDGAGMASQPRTDGIGITGMRDRIESTGGQFEIISSVQDGTCVRASIPDSTV